MNQDMIRDFFVLSLLDKLEGILFVCLGTNKVKLIKSALSQLLGSSHKQPMASLFWFLVSFGEFTAGSLFASSIVA